jgi:hypothetical protein
MGGGVCVTMLTAILLRGSKLETWLKQALLSSFPFPTVVLVCVVTCDFRSVCGAIVEKSFFKARSSLCAVSKKKVSILRRDHSSSRSLKFSEGLFFYGK